MARKNVINEKNLDNLRNKSSTLVYGIDEQLSDENEELQNIIQQTIKDTKTKIGERTNEKPINYFNEINFGNAFSEIFANKNKDGGTTKEEKFKNSIEFKKYITDNNQLDINGLLLEDTNRIVSFNNYRIIQRHIPECAQALQIYKDNIISPDDYTKLIFNINYDKAISEEAKNVVEQRTKNITEKYELEEKADKIITESLMLGESYYAVLSLEDDLSMMLADPTRNLSLNEEAIRVMDKDSVSISILSENLEINDETLEALNEDLNLTEKKLDTDNAKELVARFINENVIIGSPKELLLERVEADRDKNKDTFPNGFIKRGPGRPKKGDSVDNKPMYINRFLLEVSRT